MNSSFEACKIHWIEDFEVNPAIAGLAKERIMVTVHGFKGSEVQGSILVPGLDLGYVFTKKASALSGLIQNLEPNWQLFGIMRIFNEGFRSSMTSLSLTLNVEP